MTQTRRGFFGRIAALFAAPVVAKLPAEKAEPQLPRGESLSDWAIEWGETVYLGDFTYYGRSPAQDALDNTKTLAEVARELDPDGTARVIDDLLKPMDFYGGGNPLDDVVWKEIP